MNSVTKSTLTAMLAEAGTTINGDQLVRSQLKEDGLLMLHTIGGNVSKKYTEPWIDKYIFQHGMLPSLK